MDRIKISRGLIWVGVALLPVALNSCEKQDAGATRGASKPAVDLTNWKPDPGLPKPEISAAVEIIKEPFIKEPQRRKISMKVTATETSGLTVHEVQFLLKYRVFNEETRQYDYPSGMVTPKMIPRIEKGVGLFQTPIVEKHLREVAWDSENDNWEVEIRSYNQYYRE